MERLELIGQVKFSFKEASAAGLVSITVYGTVYADFTATVSQSSSQFSITGLFATAGIVADTQDITIAIQKLNNPESQVSSSSFTITTFDSSSNAIDQTSSGLTVSSTSPGVISLQTITPSSTTVDEQITVQMYENTDISTSGAFLKSLLAF